MVDWASIETKAGARYQLTPTDVLWAGRMVQGEGDGPEVLWAMSQRFALTGMRGEFAKFIRAYSQPINPLWLRNGACCCGPGACPAGGPFCNQPECAPGLIERRERISSARWEDLDAATRDVTLRWAKAMLSNPVPRATDFAVPRVVAGFVRRNPGAQILERLGNWFVAAPGAIAWPVDFVRLRLGDRVATAGSTSSGLVVGLLALLGAGVGGYAVAKRRRR